MEALSGLGSFFGGADQTSESTPPEETDPVKPNVEPKTKQKSKKAAVPDKPIFQVNRAQLSDSLKPKSMSPIPEYVKYLWGMCVSEISTSEKAQIWDPSLSKRLFQQEGPDVVQVVFLGKDSSSYAVPIDTVLLSCAFQHGDPKRTRDVFSAAPSLTKRPWHVVCAAILLVSGLCRLRLFVTALTDSHYCVEALLSAALGLEILGLSVFANKCIDRAAAYLQFVTDTQQLDKFVMQNLLSYYEKQGIHHHDRDLWGRHGKTFPAMARLYLCECRNCAVCENLPPFVRCMLLQVSKCRSPAWMQMWKTIDLQLLGRIVLCLPLYDELWPLLWLMSLLRLSQATADTDVPRAWCILQKLKSPDDIDLALGATKMLNMHLKETLFKRHILERILKCDLDPAKREDKKSLPDPAFSLSTKQDPPAHAAKCILHNFGVLLRDRGNK